MKVSIRKNLVTPLTPGLPWVLSLHLFVSKFHFSLKVVSTLRFVVIDILELKLALLPMYSESHMFLIKKSYTKEFSLSIVLEKTSFLFVCLNNIKLH